MHQRKEISEGLAYAVSPHWVINESYAVTTKFPCSLNRRGRTHLLLYLWVWYKTDPYSHILDVHRESLIRESTIPQGRKKRCSTFQSTCQVSLLTHLWFALSLWSSLRLDVLIATVNIDGCWCYAMIMRSKGSNTCIIKMNNLQLDTYLQWNCLTPKQHGDFRVGPDKNFQRPTLCQLWIY